MRSATTAAGTSVEFFDTIGSTNEEALMRARAGARGPLWIVARRQEAGRGRRGRRWISEAGNLYATLLLTEPSPPDRAPELSFVAALAIHDAVTEAAPVIVHSLSLKWPNDVLLGGKKFAGILVEGEGTFGTAFVAAVGIGVNCAHHPVDVAFPATDLASAGVVLTPNDLFRTLAVTMPRRLDQWACGAGFAQTRSDWLARGPRSGDAMIVRLDQQHIEGRFETLDEVGRLVLRLPDATIKAITAGEVLALGGTHRAEPLQR
ncbi:MAG: biotin--[acetyl-CoA-carboxylase] ligase [Rhizobiales bacterium]|nr:biotin--[acetyl-CoA-carboxylase] ligase [Hyphomicrobiales bacterium]